VLVSPVLGLVLALVVVERPHVPPTHYAGALHAAGAGVVVGLKKKDVKHTWGGRVEEEKKEREREREREKRRKKREERDSALVAAAARASSKLVLARRPLHLPGGTVAKGGETAAE